MQRRRVASSTLVAVTLLVGACGSSNPTSTDASVTSTPASTTAAPATTTPTAAAATTTPTAAPVTTTEAPAVTTSEPPAESWELVVFGDSFANMSGWPAQFAELIEEELGVEVLVDGDVCFGGCTSLTKIRASERLQGLIAGAEVIVVQPQPGRVVAPLWRTYLDGECGGSDGRECFRHAETDFRTYVEELFDEVIALGDDAAMIRATRATGTWAIDAFHRGLRNTDPETYDLFLENMLTLSDHVAEAAAERCILALDVDAIMSGPDYRQPVAADYSSDGLHPSTEASRVIAEALDALGYQPTPESCGDTAKDT